MKSISLSRILKDNIRIQIKKCYILYEEDGAYNNDLKLFINRDGKIVYNSQ